ncbi:MAG: MarR family winged helix-turn-helix transcriptional regulator [Eubacteriales bacterium]|nr:MarR family winged helix-turn-helix transcriptional regulator [Eubacteriales bacterium]
MDDGIESLLNGQQFKRFQEKFWGSVTAQYSLSVLDVRILLFLDAHKCLDTARDIVKVHHWTKSHVSKAIEELIERGYLQRQIDARDRRKVHLIVQPTAEPVLEQIRAEYQRMNQILLTGISEEELNVVAQVARKISDNIASCMK